MRKREKPKKEHFKGELYDCAICGFTYHKVELVFQEGRLVCKKCIDYPGHFPKGTTFK